MPRPLPPLRAHPPGLCLLTPVTLGQPALRAGYQGLRSFLEREERIRKHQELHHSIVYSDTQRRSEVAVYGTTTKKQVFETICAGQSPFSKNARLFTELLFQHS